MSKIKAEIWGREFELPIIVKKFSGEELYHIFGANIVNFHQLHLRFRACLTFDINKIRFLSTKTKKNIQLIN